MESQHARVCQVFLHSHRPSVSNRALLHATRPGVTAISAATFLLVCGGLFGGVHNDKLDWSLSRFEFQADLIL